METHLVTNDCFQIAILHQADQFIDLFQVVREWFFNEQVTARLSCPDRGRDVQAGWVADESHFRHLGQSLLQILEDAQAIFFIQACPFFNLQLVGKDWRIGPGIIGDDFDIVAPQHPQIPQVTLADSAESHDKGFHLVISSQLKAINPNKIASERILDSALPSSLRRRWLRAQPAR